MVAWGALNFSGVLRLLKLGPPPPSINNDCPLISFQTILLHHIICETSYIKKALPYKAMSGHKSEIRSMYLIKLLHKHTLSMCIYSEDAKTQLPIAPRLCLKQAIVVWSLSNQNTCISIYCSRSTIDKNHNLLGQLPSIRTIFK